MIESVHPKHFAAIPYLEESSLFKQYRKGLSFSLAKPNVIVGPNGSGKSALLDALALLTLSYYGGVSALDNHYVCMFDSKTYWTKADRWLSKPEYLANLQAKTDHAPAMHYASGQIPGRDDSITAAMMTGYFEEARAYGKLTDGKSSGEKGQAVLASVHGFLTSPGKPELRHGKMNWSHRKPAEQPSRLDSEAERVAVLYEMTDRGDGSGIPVALLDEPESSLDARAELALWKALAETDCSNRQVIVATHSLWPFLHPERFNVIETEKGYLKKVRGML